jgi:hypothetical protein
VWYYCAMKKTNQPRISEQCIKHAICKHEHIMNGYDNFQKREEKRSKRRLDELIYSQAGLT